MLSQTSKQMLKQKKKKKGKSRLIEKKNQLDHISDDAA